MKTRKKCWLGLALAAGLARPGWGQGGPAAPAAAAPGPAVATGPPVPGAVPAPLPGGMLGNMIAACNYCKAKFCASTMGQLVSNSMRPVGVFSGGLFGNCCPPDAVTAAELALPPDSAAG